MHGKEMGAEGSFAYFLKTARDLLDYRMTNK